MAAALAYYSFFAVAPVVIIAIAVAGQVFGQDAARGELSRQLRELMGDSGASAVEALVASASGHRAGAIATLVGIGALLFGATGVFAQLHGSLNLIWKARSRRTNSFAGWVRRRFLSFAVVLGIGFLLLVSLVFSAAIAALSSWLRAHANGWAVVGELLNNGLSLGGATLLFAAIFKLLPDAPVRWREVWLGAAVTALLLTVGKLGLAWFLGGGRILSTYGAAASLAALLIWVYYSSMILLFGAELSHATAMRSRGETAPAPRPPGTDATVAVTGTGS